MSTYWRLFRGAARHPGRPDRVLSEAFRRSLVLNVAPLRCLVCPDRPAGTSVARQLCARHWGRLKAARAAAGPGLDFAAWLAGERSYPGLGDCRVLACTDLAWSTLA
jgi:hypothetical protein